MAGDPLPWEFLASYSAKCGALPARLPDQIEPERVNHPRPRLQHTPRLISRFLVFLELTRLTLRLEAGRNPSTGTRLPLYPTAALCKNM